MSKNPNVFLDCIELGCLVLKFDFCVIGLSSLRLLNGFYFRIRTEFLNILEMSPSIVLPFCAMYLCKSLIITKSKYQSTLKDTEVAVCLAISIFSQV